jgi:hypothetical protein
MRQVRGGKRFKQDLTDAVKDIPRVEAASLSTQTPLDGNSWSLSVIAANSQGGERGSSKFTWVSPAVLLNHVHPAAGWPRVRTPR